ncbi:MAG: hypothetical protein HY747_09115 [Elusimicrobia bacterium]|nr:hypothetical protein [Elusimicrobiota bacterium]
MSLSGLGRAWTKTIRLFEKTKTPYVTIGGLAVAVVGEPRATVDLDFDVKIERTSVDKISAFIETAAKLGFKVDKKQVLEDAACGGAFCLSCYGKRIDFILASTLLEEDIFKRRQKILLLGSKAYFPSPEDLILLKIVPGRTQDLADIEKIVSRHRGRLDLEYLLGWGRKLSDEAENFRIYNTLKSFCERRVH